jgi:glycosyltransferase involved in cell wall biosynthesis
MKPPTISAVVPVYNTERYVGAALTAILSQTHPPDEVIVVDDGSTDGTQEELARFRGDIRVVKQSNLGVAGAMNRCFEEARGEYVAKCDADDIWEPDKLERQVETLLVHPEIDIALSGSRFFGLSEGPRAPYPGAGLLDPAVLARRLYDANFVCSCTTVIRRDLYRQLGQFSESIACEDYDYWLRALTAGAVFFYDPRDLVRCRAHPQQVSGNVLRMHEAEYTTHRLHSDLVEDSRFVEAILARDLSNIARVLSDQDRPREARAVFASSLRHKPTLRVLAWVIVLSIPDRVSRPLADGLVSIKRALISAVRRRASPA